MQNIGAKNGTKTNKTDHATTYTIPIDCIR